jgi:O-antigen ligase
MVLAWGGWRRRGVWLLLGTAALGYGAGLSALPLALGLEPGGFTARLAGADAACSSRVVLWRNVLELIAARKGLGAWRHTD